MGTSLLAQDDIAPLSDEFDDAGTLSQWQRLYDVEGWHVDQLEAWDINTTIPGHMRISPRTSAWFMDLKGPLAYKEITGDFVVTTRLQITSRHNPANPDEAPNRSFSLAGIFARSPRNITSAAPTPYTSTSVWPPDQHGSDWTPDGENYIFLSYGSGGNPGVWQYEVKSTREGNSRLYYNNSGVPDSGEIELQLVRIGQTFVVLRRHPGGDWIVENRYPNPDHPLPNMGETIQVGLCAYTDWPNIVNTHYSSGNHQAQFHHNYTQLNGQPDLHADVDYVRYRRPDPALTEALLQALPTSYDPTSNTSTATPLPATGAGEFLGDNVDTATPSIIGFSESTGEISEIQGTTARFSVYRSGDTNQAINANITVVGGNAEEGADITLLTTQLAWAPGNTNTQYVSYSSLADDLDEGDETITLRLDASAGVQVSPHIATITIIDDDVSPGFPNIHRTPGELLSGLNAPTQGRTANIAYHNGILYTIPELPSSAPNSDFQVRTWDISDPTAPVETAQLGLSPQPIAAHGHIKSGDYLIMGANWPPDAPWSFRATDPFVNERTTFPNLITPGDRGTMYQPWYVGPMYWSYNVNQEPAQIWKNNQQLATWDHIGLTGVIGHPILIGNLLVYAADQSRTGIATYDISDPSNPILLDVLTTGGPGGYWPEPFALDGRLYIVFPYRTGGNGIRVVEITDPTDLHFVADIPLPGDESMYLQFQDEYAFAGDHKVDMRTFQSVLFFDGANTVRTNDGGTGISTSQFALPIGNLLATGGASHNQGMAIWAHQAAPDTRGPSVAYHIPRAGQTNYPVGGAISLLIHETIETPTLKNGHTFIVRPVGGTPLPGRITWAFDDTLTFSPDHNLQSNTVYEVMIPAGGIKDAAGNGIEGLHFTFSTGSSTGGNQAPVVDQFSATPYPAQTNEFVTFTASVSDPNPGTTELRFDFGDGSPRTPWSTVTNALHSYALPGHYRAIVQVRNTSGLIASRTHVVTVVESIAPLAASSASSPIIFDDLTQRVFTVNPDNHTLTAVDTGSLETLYEVTTARDPRAIAQDITGNLWIPCHDEDVIDVLAASNGSRRVRLALDYGAAPHAAVCNPEGTEVYITLSGSGDLVRFNAFTGLETGRVALGPRPRAMAISADGMRGYVTRFISDQNHAEVWEVDLQNMVKLRTFILRKFGGEDHRDGTADGRGVPNYLTGITLTPDGQSLWVTAKKDNTDRGLLFGPDLDPDNTVRAIIVRVNLHSGQVDRVIDLDNSDSPSAIAYTALGDYFFVTLQGNNAVLIFDEFRIETSAGLGALAQRLPAGAAPQGVCIDTTNNQVFIKNFLGRSITTYEIESFLTGGSTTIPTTEIDTVHAERLPHNILDGKRIFYHAGDPRMSGEGYLSCATCHLDGGHDGRNWDFTGRGEGLRNTIDLRGRSGLAHGALHWSANFDEIQDFESDIRNAFGGTGFLSNTDFAATSDPLGPSKAGLSYELDALAAYVSSLANETVPKSPHRDSAGNLTEDALAGEALFASLNCISCHAGVDLTDSTLPPQLNHNVGTLRTSSGQRLGAALSGIDTPSLLGLWDSGPYLHDGSADNLMDVFINAGGLRYHAESGTVFGAAIIQEQYVEGNYDDSVHNRALVRLQNQGGGVRFENVTGGSGGLGAIEIRYSSNAHALIVRVNGLDQEINLPPTGNSPNWRHTNWRQQRVENIHLLAGPDNTIELVANSMYADISIDEIVVTTIDERTLANPHRTVLTRTPTEQNQLIAYLEQISNASLSHLYYAWARQQGLLNVDFAADTDADGLTSYQEWVQDLNPLLNDRATARMTGQIIDSNTFEVQFRRNSNTHHLHWQAQVSTNLVDWINIPTISSVLNPDPDGDQSAETIRWQVDVSPTWSPFFIRHVVSEQNTSPPTQ